MVREQRWIKANDSYKRKKLQARRRNLAVKSVLLKPVKILKKQKAQRNLVRRKSLVMLPLFAQNLRICVVVQPVNSITRKFASNTKMAFVRNTKCEERLLILNISARIIIPTAVEACLVFCLRRKKRNHQRKLA